MSFLIRIRPAGRRRAAPPALLALPLALAAAPARAQTDYYNTDAGRPVSVEDAYPIERRAVELQLAPLRLTRARGAAYTWGVEPEIAVGLLPRTQIEIGAPVAYADRPGGRRAGLAGLEVAALHNLNVETRIPALAVAVEALLPVGSLAPARTYVTAKGIATRTLPWARFHLNGAYTFGDAPAAPISLPGDAAPDDAHAELARWAAGVAVDRTLPLRSLLVTAELVARGPLVEAGADADVQWDTAAGARWQLGPRVAVDGGAGYRLTGERGWFATFGAAVSLGLPWRS